MRGINEYMRKDAQHGDMPLTGVHGNEEDVGIAEVGSLDRRPAA